MPIIDYYKNDLESIVKNELSLSDLELEQLFHLIILRFKISEREITNVEFILSIYEKYQEKEFLLSYIRDFINYIDNTYNNTSLVECVEKFFQARDELRAKVELSATEKILKAGEQKKTDRKTSPKNPAQLLDEFEKMIF